MPLAVGTQSKGQRRRKRGVLGQIQMDHNIGKLFRPVLICLQLFTLAALSQRLVTDFVSVCVCACVSAGEVKRRMMFYIRSR